MNYELFDIKDYKILAPLKCGTRYLKLCIGESKTITSDFLRKTHTIEGVKKIIVREPYKHLSSALHTAILTEIQNNHINQLKIPHEEVIRKYLTQFRYLNEDLKNVHWSKTTYEDLYLYWRRNIMNVGIIYLSDLSTFLKEEGVDVVHYNEDNYNFKGYNYWISKEDLMELINQYYKIEWDYLKKQLDESDIWFNRLKELRSKLV